MTIEPQPTLFPTEADDETAHSTDPTLDQRIEAMAASGDRRNRDTGWDPNKADRPGWANPAEPPTNPELVERESAVLPGPSSKERAAEARRLGCEVEEIDPDTLKPLPPHELYGLR